MTTEDAQTVADPATAPPGTADPATPQSTPAAPAQAAPKESLLADPAVPAPGPNDWLPEKFRVMAADGTALDEAASARKLAASYVELEKAKPVTAPPTPDDYDVKAADGVADQVDFDAFVADPLFGEFKKEAHALNFSNEQLSFAVNKYLALVPELLGADKQLTAADAKAELAKLWGDPTVMDKNLGVVTKAIQGFGGEAPDMPGSRDRLMDKYGTDPDFIAFAAAVARDMPESGDTPVGATISADMDIEALARSKAYWDQNDPTHAQVKQRVTEFYARKHGDTKRR